MEVVCDLDLCKSHFSLAIDFKISYDETSKQHRVKLRECFTVWKDDRLQYSLTRLAKISDRDYQSMARNNEIHRLKSLTMGSCQEIKVH